MNVSKKIHVMIWAMFLLFDGFALAESVKEMDVLDSKGMPFDVDIPKWLENALDGDYSLLEKEYKGAVIYFAEWDGQDLDGLKYLVQHFQVNENFSHTLSTAAIAKIRGNSKVCKESEGNEDFLNDIENAFAQIFYHGLELKKDYWIQIRTYKDKKESCFEDSYHYYVVYAMDRNILKRQVESVLERVEAESAVQQKMKKEAISFMDEVKFIIKPN